MDILYINSIKRTYDTLSKVHERWAWRKKAQLNPFI